LEGTFSLGSDLTRIEYILHHINSFDCINSLLTNSFIANSFITNSSIRLSPLNIYLSRVKKYIHIYDISLGSTVGRRDAARRRLRVGESLGAAPAVASSPLTKTSPQGSQDDAADGTSQQGQAGDGAGWRVMVNGKAQLMTEGEGPKWEACEPQAEKLDLQGPRKKKTSRGRKKGKAKNSLKRKAKRAKAKKAKAEREKAEREKAEKEAAVDRVRHQIVTAEK
jgi:hypothetical protein